MIGGNYQSTAREPTIELERAICVTSAVASPRETVVARRLPGLGLVHSAAAGPGEDGLAASLLAGAPKSGSKALTHADAPGLPCQSATRAGLGGGRGIRTLDTVARIHAFQACAFSRSATPPAPGSARTIVQVAGLTTRGRGRRKKSSMAAKPQPRTKSAKAAASAPATKNGAKPSALNHRGLAVAIDSWCASGRTSHARDRAGLRRN
jgi:hypothetical protein